MERRAFITTVGSALLLRAAFGRHAFSATIQTDMQRWLLSLHRHCSDLRRDALTPVQWQRALEDLYRIISPQDLIRFIDFDKLIDGLDYPEDQSAIAPVRFPGVAGLPKRRGWVGKIFGNRKGSAVAPHAHNDMVSAHFIIRGSFHVRTFHRRFQLERPGRLVLEPAVDGVFSAGKLLTMSDERHNVHWLQAVSDHAYTFDVPVTNLGGNRTYVNKANKYSMIFVDPDHARKTSDGFLETGILDVHRAIARYGKV
ncbi:MAG: hypothetical protein QNK37_11450 [Acidobacteriota bacterium]|nr:hypothetical protein [Acidobacteriota bacterium]